jgi:hypothetical protein
MDGASLGVLFVDEEYSEASPELLPIVRNLRTLWQAQLNTLTFST